MQNSFIWQIPHKTLTLSTTPSKASCGLLLRRLTVWKRKNCYSAGQAINPFKPLCQQLNYVWCLGGYKWDFYPQRITDKSNTHSIIQSYTNDWIATAEIQQLSNCPSFTLILTLKYIINLKNEWTWKWHSAHIYLLSFQSFRTTKITLALLVVFRSFHKFNSTSQISVNLQN